MDHRQFSDINEFGNTDDQRVAELLNSLPRVEAPANFDFGFKAKMASANEVVPTASLIPFAKIFAPFSLLLLVGGFVVFYQTMPDANGPLAAADPTPIQQTPFAQFSPEVAEAPAVNQSSGPQLDEVATSMTERVSVSQPPRPVRRATSSSNRAIERTGDEKSTSTDIGLTSPVVINPPGFESGEIPLRDVLGILGIEPDSADGMKVKSTVGKSPAERSGIKSNDVLEAIDGVALTQKTTFRGPFSPKTLRIRRGGKTIVVNLRN
jgi:hypothetical protein